MANITLSNPFNTGTGPESMSDQTNELQHVSNTNLALSMFGTIARHTTVAARVTNYNFTDLKQSAQATPIEGGHDPRLVTGNGKRPVYGQQYPRGYYNK